MAGVDPIITFCAETNGIEPKENNMNIVRNSGMLMLILGLATAATQAAEKEAKPNATLRLSGKSIAVGIGFSWGSGTLTYKGKDYPISVKGVSVAKVGISGSGASGEVYNLKKLSDFDGHYHAGGAGRRGVTLASGQAATTMTNDKGVRVLLASTQQGVDVTLAGSGVDLKIKK